MLPTYNADMLCYDLLTKALFKNLWTVNKLNEAKQNIISGGTVQWSWKRDWFLLELIVEYHI